MNNRKNVVSRLDRNLARRLKEARKETGLSVRSVAAKLPKRLAVSHTTIASYENGTTAPPIGILSELANIYSRPINWFLNRREILSGVRYLNLQSRVPLAAQQKYVAQAGKLAEGYIALETYMKVPGEKKRDELCLDSPIDVARRVRTEHLNLEDSQPVQNVVAALELFSTWAIELRADFKVDGASALFGRHPVVVFNPTIANERVRINAAIELAYVLFSKHPLNLLSTEVEERANAFALNLLMPDSQIQEAFSGKSFLKLIQFKERFGVSIAHMIHRAVALGVINTSVSRWLRSEMVKRGWNKIEPGYVWRDRAINFETLLETAIQSKKITWEDAERITSIPIAELKKRLLSVYVDHQEKEDGVIFKIGG